MVRLHQVYELPIYSLGACIHDVALSTLCENLDLISFQHPCRDGFRKRE